MSWLFSSSPCGNGRWPRCYFSFRPCFLDFSVRIWNIKVMICIILVKLLILQLGRYEQGRPGRLPSKNLERESWRRRGTINWPQIMSGFTGQNVNWVHEVYKKYIWQVRTELTNRCHLMMTSLDDEGSCRVTWDCELEEVWQTVILWRLES